MTTDVIVLNGGSSSGKSSIAAALQSMLPEVWLALGIDTFIEALPARLTGADDGATDGGGADDGTTDDGTTHGGAADGAGDGEGAGIRFEDDGQIDIGPTFARLERCWMRGIGTMARSGARILVEDGFLGGPAAQQRWREALVGLDVLWVGVRCAAEVAAERERLRGDRHLGMAAQQAVMVHRGIAYDLEVDTTTLSTAAAARRIAEHLRQCDRAAG